MTVNLTACLFACVIAGRSALGAEIFYMDHDSITHEYTGSVGPLVFSGEIVAGDYDRLLAKIAENRGRFMASNKILLAGEDGDLAEAIKIAALIKSLSTEVVVGPLTGRCVGACFLIFAAADQRVTDGRNLLGTHRPELLDSEWDALPPLDAEAVKEGAAAWARAHLEQNGVPEHLVSEMLGHTPEEVYWLSDDDEQNLGVLSRSLQSVLTEKCAWTDSLERDVYKGARPMADLTALWACRTRLTLPAARKALDLALEDKAAREGKLHRLGGNAERAGKAAKTGNTAGSADTLAAQARKPAGKVPKPASNGKESSNQPAVKSTSDRDP